MKTIRFHSTQVLFPDACVLCLGYPHKPYKIERTFTHGRRSIILSLPVPMCRQHYEMASRKSLLQTWTERLSPLPGLLLGIVAGAGLLLYWSSSGQGSLWLNIAAALFIGISITVTVWAILLFWVAPLFSSVETKAVHNSIRMTHYDPFRQVLELAFSNAAAAELTARENLPILILNGDNVRQYRISAHLQDDDIRLSRRVETRVLLDHTPTEREGRELLQPVIDKILVQQLGKDTFYDVDEIVIEEETLENE